MVATLISFRYIKQESYLTVIAIVTATVTVTVAVWHATKHKAHLRVAHTYRNPHKPNPID